MSTTTMQQGQESGLRISGIYNALNAGAEPWSVSTNNQAELIARASGHRSGIQTTAAQQAEQLKKEREENSAAARHYAAEMARQAYEEAYNDAMKFYDDKIRDLEQQTDDLDETKAEFHKNTIRLSDGREVYVDEHGHYVTQNENGGWDELEEEYQEEARERHKQMGKANSTEGKETLDKYEGNLPMLLAQMQQHQAQAMKIKQEVDNGEKDPAEAEREINKNKQDDEADFKIVKNQKDQLKSGGFAKEYKESSPSASVVQNKTAEPIRLKDEFTASVQAKPENSEAAPAPNEKLDDLFASVQEETVPQPPQTGSPSFS